MDRDFDSNEAFNQGEMVSLRFVRDFIRTYGAGEGETGGRTDYRVEINKIVDDLFAGEDEDNFPSQDSGFIEEENDPFSVKERQLLVLCLLIWVTFPSFAYSILRKTRSVNRLRVDINRVDQYKARFEHLQRAYELFVSSIKSKERSMYRRIQSLVDREERKPVLSIQTLQKVARFITDDYVQSRKSKVTREVNEIIDLFKSDNPYYPYGWNPPGFDQSPGVTNWGLVKHLVGVVLRGEEVDPFLADGEFGNGNLLTGVHRATANDVLTELGDKRRIDYIQVEDLPPNLREQVMEYLETDDTDAIHDLLDRD